MNFLNVTLVMTVIYVWLAVGVLAFRYVFKDEFPTAIDSRMALKLVAAWFIWPFFSATRLIQLALIKKKERTNK